ncbi:zinc finger, CCHC-type containing protein [Tanacetum coccineum]
MRMTQTWMKPQCYASRISMANLSSTSANQQSSNECIDTSSASNAIFEINKLRQQLQGKDDTIRNLDAQINIMKVLKVGTTKGSCDQQAFETDRIQLKDTITSLRIQLDGLKVEHVGSRRYDERQSEYSHHVLRTQKASALTAENTKLKAQVTGQQVIGPSTSKTQVIFFRNLQRRSKYIPPPKRANWVKPSPLPKQKQVTFQEPHRTSTRPTQKPQVQQNKKPNVSVNLSTRTKPATEPRKPMPKSDTRNHRIWLSKSENARRAADHNRNLNFDHNQFVIRSLKSVNTKTPQAKHNGNHTKKVWKATRKHNVNTTKTLGRPKKGQKDVLFADLLLQEIDTTKNRLQDMGDADVILSIRIKHESNGIAISQSHYIEKLDSNTKDNSSTSGWVFLLGGGAISWASKKQTCITGSTMESKFVALAAAGKEAEWLKNLVLEISMWSKSIAPIFIRCDTAATLAKAYSQMYNGKSRHLGVRHCMIHELITNGVISIEFVRSQQKLVDYLTKELARDLVIKYAEGMGLNICKIEEQTRDSLDAKYMAKDASSKKFLDEALDKFKVFKSEVELQQGSKIKRIRTDRGREYMDTLYFQSVGIIHEMIAPYTLQQNGISKRKNRVLKEIVNSMLSYSGLSQGFWGEAMAVVRLPDPKLKTLGERGIECIFVGYAEHSKTFRFYVIEPNDSVSINSIIESRDAIFDESRFSSVLRPSLRIPNETKDIGGSMVPEEVTEEVVQQPEPELRKSKRNRTSKDFGPEFQLYLIEGTRDEVSCDNHDFSRLDNQSIERDRLNGIRFVLDFVEFISFTFGDKEMISVIEAISR